MSGDLAASNIPNPDELHSLPILILNVHENCNCRCGMCEIWKRPAGKELSLDRASTLQESIRNLGVQQIVLTGGEPLMHSRFDALCRILKQENVRLTLLTTGLLLAKKAASIAELIDEVIVSLDGPPEVHNRIRGIAKAHELLREGIAGVRSLRPTLPINARSTIQRENFTYLRQTLRTAMDLGCGSISFLAVDTSSQAFNRDLIWPAGVEKTLGISGSAIEQLEQEMEELIREQAESQAGPYVVENPAKLRRLVRYFREMSGELPPQSPRCNAPWVSAVFELDNTVRPCFFQPKIADVSMTSLHEAINSESAKKFRKTLNIETNPVCQRCVCSLNRPQ